MFFKNSELDSDFVKAENINCSFSHFLIDEDLPKFGSGKEFIKKFDYTPDDLGSGIINRSIMKRDTLIINEIKQDMKGIDVSKFTIPIVHTIQDLNGSNLMNKIEQLREHKDLAIKNKPITESYIANLMFKLNEKYPTDIDEHHGLRNIIDL